MERQREYHRRYYAEHREQGQKISRDYRAKHPDLIQEYNRKYRADPEHKKQQRKYDCKRRVDPEYREKVRERSREYRIKYPERMKKARDDRYASLKMIVYNHYGYSCVGCGETERVVLSIDHINGGGNKHRREISRSSNKGTGGGGLMYYWLIKNNFPEGFRVLCRNCQERARFGVPLPFERVL